MKHWSRTFKSSRGFTLIESLLALFVLGIVMSILFYAFLSSTRLLSEEYSEQGTSFEVHKAAERMTLEIRNGLAIITGSSESITFWLLDLNGNGSRESNETAEYVWVPTQEALYRVIGANSVRISNNIVVFALSYDDPGNIRKVNISITSRLGTTLTTLESSVKSRNL